MKTISLFCLMFLATACTSTGSVIESNTSPEKSASTSNYDAELAQSLGADDYGMRSYVFATLLTGPNDTTITDEKQRAELFEGHFSNMSRLAEQGKLVLAGPYIEGAPKRGLFIFNVKTIEEAQELVKSDPSIAAGIFQVEFTKYYGSAALIKVNDIHKNIQKTSVN